MACGTASCGDLLIQELWSILSVTLGVFPRKYRLPTLPAIGEAISKSLCSLEQMPLSYVSLLCLQGVFEFETFLWLRFANCQRRPIVQNLVYDRLLLLPFLKMFSAAEV